MARGRTLAAAATAIRACLLDCTRCSPRARVLAAVSGGSDSTALLHLLAEQAPALAVDVTVVHLDHGLRPDSASDAAFVVALAARLGYSSVIETAPVAELARQRRLGLEEAGRHARYELFRRQAESCDARAVLLAHTLDDQAETLLLRLARGAATRGLAAMRATRGGLYRRPLLAIRRAELRAYLAAKGETFRDDPSHEDMRFARNRVRREVLPVLARINPRVWEALARAARRLAEDEDCLQALAMSALAPPGVEGALDAPALAALPVALARRAAHTWLRRATADSPDLGHEHIDAVLALARGRGCRAPARATDLPGGQRVMRRGALLVLVPAVAPSAAPVPGPATRPHDNAKEADA